MNKIPDFGARNEEFHAEVIFPKGSEKTKTSIKNKAMSRIKKQSPKLIQKETDKCFYAGTSRGRQFVVMIPREEYANTNDAQEIANFVKESLDNDLSEPKPGERREYTFTYNVKKHKVIKTIFQDITNRNVR